MPAAGRGSRLGLDIPKLLAPITDEATIWTLLRDKLEGLVDFIHVVASPRDRDTIERALRGAAHGTRISIGIQDQPIGMGDAIFRGYSVWSQVDAILVLWADQVHVSRETLLAALRLHRNVSRRVVLPLVALPKPYVEYVFDSTGQLSAVRESREGDCCQPDGLGDVGTFVLSTHGLNEEWLDYVRRCRAGTLTAELNFLPFLVFLAQRHWEVKPLYVADTLEARGVNTPEDLEFFRRLYASRSRKASR